MFNKAELTNICIDFTLRNAGVDHQILVVDDGSSEHFVYEHERVKVIRLESNTGFTNAVNQGIIKCGEKFKFIHLLNNDTEPEPNFLKHLVDAMELDEEIGIASSSRVHKNSDGSIKYIENYGADLSRGNQIISSGNLPAELVRVDWVPFCSVLLRRSMIVEIGLLDKQFRNHCSDSDYCIRANMNEWKVALITESRVLHHLSQTTKANGITPDEDQNRFVAKIAGLKYAELMKRIPLDSDREIYGKLEFSTYTK